MIQNKGGNVEHNILTLDKLTVLEIFMIKEEVVTSLCGEFLRSVRTNQGIDFFVILIQGLQNILWLRTNKRHSNCAKGYLARTIKNLL